MSTKTEGFHAGEFIFSESEGEFSRDKVTIASGRSLGAGAVLGKVTASGKYVAVNPAASDGSQTAVAVLFDAVDATSADKIGTAMVRNCEVNGRELDYNTLNAGQITTANGQLASVGIIVRGAI